MARQFTLKNYIQAGMNIKLLMLMLVLFSFISLEVSAQEAVSQSPKSKTLEMEKDKPEKDKNRNAVVAEFEAFSVEEQAQIENDALSFAEAHHSELAKLLKNLKKHDRVQYTKGIMELRKTQQRLDKVKDKFPERYERELNLWTLNSRIRLQVARILVTGTQEDHNKLTALLTEKRQTEINYLQNELVRLKGESQKLEDRKAKIESDLSSKKNDLDNWVKTEKERLLKSGKPNLKTPEKTPAKNKPANKQDGENSKADN